MTEGITKFIIQIPNAPASILKILFENKLNIKTLALALTGNSVKPIVGIIAIMR